MVRLVMIGVEVMIKILDALKVIIDFITGVIDAIVSAIAFISMSNHVFFGIVGFLPSVISGFVIAGVAILMIRFLLLR